jgi:glucose/arabinose dehydrogenase
MASTAAAAAAAVRSMQPFTGNKTVVTDRLPGDQWHGRRVLRFSPEGLLVLAVGVPCNVCKLNRTAEGIQFGTIYSLNTTSGELRQMATGAIIYV